MYIDTIFVYLRDFFLINYTKKKNTNDLDYYVNCIEYIIISRTTDSTVHDNDDFLQCDKNMFTHKTDEKFKKKTK